MHGIERRLVAGVAVNGRHEALFDADEVVQHLGDGREAVRRAGCIRNDEMILGELVVVHAEDHGEISSICGRRDEHALGACRKMSGSLVAGR